MVLGNLTVSPLPGVWTGVKFTRLGLAEPCLLVYSSSFLEFVFSEIRRLCGHKKAEA